MQLDSDPPVFHPVVFENLDASLIRFSPLRTRDTAGPSGIDAQGWRRLCTSFKQTSNDLCQSLASTVKHLCTTLVDPKSIAPLMVS